MGSVSEFAPDLAYRNVEAEQSVLGAALQDAKAAELVAEMADDEFFEPEHRVIHATIRKMVREHTPIDLVTTHKAMKDQKLDAIIGPQYLTKLIQQTPTAANVKTYINIVRECCSRRRLKAIGQALIGASADGTRKVDEIREQAALTIRDVKAGEGVRLISQEEAAMATFEKLSEHQKREDQPETERIATGIKGIDKRTGGGLIGSKLMMIGARPSVGKSIFALTMCLNAARNGKRVLFSTLEMEADDGAALSHFIPYLENIVLMRRIEGGQHEGGHPEADGVARRIRGKVVFRLLFRHGRRLVEILVGTHPVVLVLGRGDRQAGRGNTPEEEIGRDGVILGREVPLHHRTETAHNVIDLGLYIPYRLFAARGSAQDLPLLIDHAVQAEGLGAVDRRIGQET